MALRVSRDEYEAELRELSRLQAELSPLRAEYDKKWDRLRGAVANIRRNEARLAELTRRLETLRRIGWARLTRPERAEYLRLRDRLIPEARSRIDYWTSQRDAILAEIYREMPEIHRLEEAIRTERERIRRKIPISLIAVVDSTTGYLIQYLEFEFKGYKCWLYDEKRNRLVEPVTAIKIEKTISLRTPGHEDLIAEITASTIIAPEDLFNLDEITREMEFKAQKWFREEKFANVDKYGNIVLSNFKFFEDFDIQRRRGARYQMEIIEWYKTVTGEWAERPRVIKEGFGAYSTDETPTYPTIEVYTEYSHEDEPFPAHREPPRGAEYL